MVREAAERQHPERAKVELRGLRRSGKLEVEISDLGMPVSEMETRQARSSELAAEGLVDELHLGAHGREGNLARVAVHLEPVDAELAEPQLDADGERASDEDAAQVEVRPMEAVDAAELVRCVYRCYGYSYKDPILYEPEHIADALRDGLMTSVVAALPDGSVIGHSAIFVERAGDAVPEAGRMLVDPRFRGHGIATRLAALRKKVAAERGITGYWLEAVTNHTSSQRESLRLGASEVGLLIGGSPASVQMAGFDNVNQGRRTLLAMFAPLHPIAEQLYVPERHAEFIAALAENLGIERRIEVGDDDPEPGSESRVSTSVRPMLGVGSLHVSMVGADLGRLVADELEALDPFDLGAVHLDLPLSDPAAAGAVATLEALGFGFAAWIPRFEDGDDVLRLQRVEGHAVDVENLSFARPEGERVRDYVVSEWHRVRHAGIE